jgi:2-dehydropantoate 2-reductase
MKILVVGAGAVGGFVGSRLADAGHRVTFLVRPSRVARLRAQGLTIVTDGESSAVPADVITAADLGTVYDAVVLAVKGDAVDSVLDDIDAAVGPGTPVVSFLNGLRPVEQLQRRFGPATVGGVLRLVVEQTDETTIHQLAPVFEVELGAFPPADVGMIAPLAFAFEAGGAKTLVREDIVDALWEKWVYIASIGAVCSLAQASIGAVVGIPGGVELARTVLAEASTIARSAGHPVAEGTLQTTDAAITAEGSSTTSSLSRDAAAGRHTEVETVLADLAERGRTAGVSTPLLDAATLVLRLQNQQLARSQPGAGVSHS